MSHGADAGDAFDESGSESDKSADAPPALAICDGDNGSDHSDAAIASAQVSGDELTLGIVYSGGCALHAFELCWNGVLTAGAPYTAALGLIDRSAEEDPCRGMMSETLRFDIGPLGYAYFEATKQATADIGMALGGQATATYAYNDPLAAGFTTIARDAVVVSESDDTPIYFTAPYGKRLSKSGIRAAFVAQGYLAAGEGIEFWNKTETSEWLDGQLDGGYGEDDDEAAAYEASWQGIRGFLAQTITSSSLRAVRVGPLEEDGTLGDSAGEYRIYVFGKSPTTGRLVGFTVTVVWT